MVALIHWVYFLFFLKRKAEVLAPRLAVIFRRLLRLGSFHLGVSGIVHISPQFHRVHLPPQHPIIEQFP